MNQSQLITPTVSSKLYPKGTIETIISSPFNCTNTAFLKQFLYGDCHALADIVAHQASLENIDCRIIAIHDLVILNHGFIHSFNEIILNDKKYFIDARGVHHHFVDVVGKGFGASNSVIEALEQRYLNNELWTPETDDDHFINLVRMTDLCQNIPSDRFEDENEYVFERQNEALNYLLLQVSPNPTNEDWVIL